MSDADRILVINPNSTEAVTAGIDSAMEPLRMSGGPAIECVTLKEGPPGIETQAHLDFFRRHFAVKGVEVAEACANTLLSLERLRGQVAAGIVQSA